ncbi:MAG: LysR family transcriptional regulator [Exilibacterium sp.]
MDIELLKTFLEVKNTRHFGKAAENLYLSQAAVSARVRQLEDFLGVKLFIRSRNNIQLTAEGERLIPHAETMLVAWSRARQDVALKLEHKHQLNFGSTAGLWQYALQDKLQILHRKFPELAMRAEAHTHDELLRLITERALDLAFLYQPPNLPELTSVSIGKLRLVLASSKRDATPKNALLDNYVYVDWGTAFAIFHAKRFGDTPPAVLHTNMASVAEVFIINHSGSAYLPEQIIKESQDKKIYVVEGAPSFSREVYLVYRTSSERKELIDSIVQHLMLSNKID